MRFEILTVVTIKIPIFWNVPLCSLVYRHTTGAASILRVRVSHLRTPTLTYIHATFPGLVFMVHCLLTYSLILKTEAVNYSDTLVHSYQTKWHHIPQDSILHHLSFLFKVCYFAMKASQAARHDKMR